MYAYCNAYVAIPLYLPIYTILIYLARMCICTLYSHSDNLRSIPSVIDGLKPSQRKILYACFKKGLTQDMKVVQLAGYVAEQTAYHHGKRCVYLCLSYYPISTILVYLRMYMCTIC